MSPLDGPTLKLRRAQEHLNTIEKAIEVFKTTEPKPYSFIIKRDIQPAHYLLIANISHGPPQSWSAVIGDFAHNCRSALDLLVSQISTLAPDDDRRFSIHFPIFDLRDGNPKSPIRREHSGYLDSEDRYLRGVESKYRTVIEGFQPYKGGDSLNDPLSILAYINDADKHRILHVVGAYARYSSTSFGPGIVGTNIISGTGTGIRIASVGHAKIDFGAGFTFSTVDDGIIAQNGTIVAHLTSLQPPNVNMHPDAEVTIKFDETGARIHRRLVMDTLTLIYHRVEEVIGDIEKVA